MHRGELMDLVLRSTLPQTDRLLILAYASFFRSKAPDGSPLPVEAGRAWPSRERLAPMAGVRLSAFKTAKKRLESAGILVRDGYRGRVPCYRLDPSRIPVASTPPDEEAAAAEPDPPRIKSAGGGQNPARPDSDPARIRPEDGQNPTGRRPESGRKTARIRPQTLCREPSGSIPPEEPSTQERAAGGALDLSGLPPAALGVRASDLSADVLELLRAWFRPWFWRMSPTGDPRPGDAERVLDPSEVKAAATALRLLPLADLVDVVRMVHEAKDGTPAWLRRTGKPLRTVLRRDSLQERIQQLRLWQATGSTEPGGGSTGGHPQRRRAGDLSDVLAQLEVEGERPAPTPTAAPDQAGGRSNVVPLRAAGRS